MIGWCIFGGIVLLLVFLFTRSLTVTAEYGGEKLDLRVKYLFFTLYPQKPRKKGSPKAKARKSGNAEKTRAEQNAAEETPGTAEETGGGKKAGSRKAKASRKRKKKRAFPELAQITDYVRSASPPIKRLFKKIRIDGLTVDVTVATDDAAKTAIKYGSVCAALYPAVEFLALYFTVRVNRIRVEADFSRETDALFARGILKLRVSTALGCILWLGVRMMKTYLKYQKKQEAQA